MMLQRPGNVASGTERRQRPYGATVKARQKRMLNLWSRAEVRRGFHVVGRCSHDFGETVGASSDTCGLLIQHKSTT